VKAIVLAAIIVLGSSALALAQTATPGIDAREANQQKRIGAGIAKGQITPGEAVKLEKGQAHVQRMENRAKADGVVTAGERARIQHAQNVQSRKIYRARHNNRVAN